MTKFIIMDSKDLDGLNIKILSQGKKHLAVKFHFAHVMLSNWLYKETDLKGDHIYKTLEQLIVIS